jgi:DNA modification methylase
MTISITKKSKLKEGFLAQTKAARKANANKVAIKSAAAVALPNDLAPDLRVEWHTIDELTPAERRVRECNPEQVERAIRLIRAYGFISPVTIRRRVVVDGHIRIAAARELGMEAVPCIDVGHLSKKQARMLGISLNRLAELGEWDLHELKLELEELEIEDIDLSLTLFTDQELDIILSDEPHEETMEEDVPEPPLHPVTRQGYLWLCGDMHRVLCGNSLDAGSYKAPFKGQVAHAVLTDSPYNVKIEGNVSGLGKIKHSEFAFASGEMEADEFLGFLQTVHQHCAENLAAGAVVYSFMDWRSIDILMAAAKGAGLRHINTAVWYKGSGGMGAFLRSAHELCGVFCKGDKPRLNNVALGKFGRDRTNVWVYPGANRPGSSSGQVLKDHPTPKNLEMCADAILDVTARGDIVLDPFLGSGTTLIAAEQTSRRCHGIELDPSYVDVCIRRWQELTGKDAVLAATGQTYNELALEQEAHLSADREDEL